LWARIYRWQICEGASLVRSNLQKPNLLGTELRGANLMGANLYGSEGLWFGRLGERIYSTRCFPNRFPRLTAQKRLAMHENCPVVLFSNSRNEPALLRADCVHHGRASAAQYFRSALLAMGNVLPMTGLYLGGPLVLLVLSCDFIFYY